MVISSRDTEISSPGKDLISNSVYSILPYWGYLEVIIVIASHLTLILIILIAIIYLYNSKPITSTETNSESNITIIQERIRNYLYLRIY
jgi:hypothetical protein